MDESPVLGVCPEATGAGILIAVIDTGINFQHPHILKPARGSSVGWAHEEVVVKPGAAADLHGHGTCCAALLAWLAPDADLLSIRVADERGVTDADRLTAGIEEGTRAGAQLLLCSLGVRTRFGFAMAEAVTAAAEPAVVLAARGPDEEIIPAACADALAVGARTGVDVVRDSSGSLWAHGFARPAPGPRNFSGSSMAAARAAAACARFAEIHGLRGRRLRDGFSKALDVC